MSALADLELWQCVDAELVSLCDCFASLVRAAHVPEEDGEQVAIANKEVRRAPGDLLEVWAEKLVYAGHTSLHILSQLKKGALLGDVNALVANVRSVRTAFERSEEVANSQMGRVKLEVEALLGELEASYYSSQHRNSTVSAVMSKELEDLCKLAMECKDPAKLP